MDRVHEGHGVLFSCDERMVGSGVRRSEEAVEVGGLGFKVSLDGGDLVVEMVR